MNQAPLPPPSYQRTMATALHLDALMLVTRLHLLEVCGVAVQYGVVTGVWHAEGGNGYAPWRH